MVTVPAYIALRPSGDQRIVVTGVVVSRNTSANTAVIDINGEGAQVSCHYAGGNPNVGDVAVLIRSANRLWMVGTFGGATVDVPTEPEEPDDTTDPGEPTETTVTLRPQATGTARNGSVRPDTTDLYQGDWTGRGINAGQAVYKARQLAGTVTRARLRIRRLDAGVYAAQAPTLRLIEQTTLTGSPTWLDSKAGPALAVGDARTVTLPDSWGQKLISGQAGGIGIYVAAASPYVRLDGSAMALTLTIRKD